MFGLTVRWSLMGAPAGAAQRLRAYVRDESLARFTGMPGLHQKIWTLREGGSFSGTYIWASEQARREFVERFRANPSAVTDIIGQSPDAMEEFEVVAVAEGAEGMQGLTAAGTAFRGSPAPA